MFAPISCSQFTNNNYLNKKFDGLGYLDKIFGLISLYISSAIHYKIFIVHLNVLMIQDT
jgi:hypothetical protein